MRYPTRKALEAELAAVRITDPRSTLATLIVAVARDRAGSPTADGYPASASGAAGSGAAGSGTISADPMRLNVVESTGIARAAGLARRDPVHENLSEAFHFLDQAITAIRAFDHRVQNLVQLMGIPQPPRCEVLVSLLAEHEGTNVGGRLARPYNLSGPVFDHVRRYDRLPTTDEVHTYERYGVWRRERGTARIDPRTAHAAYADATRLALEHTEP